MFGVITLGEVKADLRLERHDGTVAAEPYRDGTHTAGMHRAIGALVMVAVRHSKGFPLTIEILDRSKGE